MDACIDEETRDAWQAAIKAVPIVRGRRKVKVERKDGTIDERDAADVVAALVERQGLEAAVREGALPIEIQRRRAAGLPDLCATCGKALGMSLNSIRRRQTNAKAWTCVGCAKRKSNAARTQEQRSEAARKANAARTPEQRRNARIKACAAMTPESLRDAARKAIAARMAITTQEQRSEAARKGKSAMTPEQRSEAVRKANASMTPEQRSERLRKSWETRRRNKEVAHAR